MGDLKTYLALVKREFGTGEATEHTHRAALKALVESFAPDIVEGEGSSPTTTSQPTRRSSSPSKRRSG